MKRNSEEKVVSLDDEVYPETPKHPKQQHNPDDYFKFQMRLENANSVVGLENRFTLLRFNKILLCVETKWLLKHSLLYKNTVLKDKAVLKIPIEYLSAYQTLLALQTSGGRHLKVTCPVQDWNPAALLNYLAISPGIMQQCYMELKCQKCPPERLRKFLSAFTTGGIAQIQDQLTPLEVIHFFTDNPEANVKWVKYCPKLLGLISSNPQLMRVFALAKLMSQLYVQKTTGFATFLGETATRLTHVNSHTPLHVFAEQLQADLLKCGYI
jgi:hypothetical protein